jgi:hypothetical protein
MKGGRNEGKNEGLNPLNHELNSIFHLTSILEAENIFHFRRIRVKETRERGR